MRGVHSLCSTVRFGPVVFFLIMRSRGKLPPQTISISFTSPFPEPPASLNAPTFFWLPLSWSDMQETPAQLWGACGKNSTFAVSFCFVNRGYLFQLADERLKINKCE